MANEIVERESDGIDRRGFLKCMAWAGTGVVLTMQSGVLRSVALADAAASGEAASAGDFTFVQISDSHIGFNKAANTNVVGTLEEAVRKIGTMPAPDFLIHTGDVSHLSKPEEFDTVEQVLKAGRMPKAFYVPGEHDVLDETGRLFRERYGKEATGDGWYSFDHKGCHFVALVNVMNFSAGGMGTLGGEQLEWLEQDLKERSSSTPVVVFAHIPLWTVYPDWGWGTSDSAQALSYLRRFGSVTVLNGHIHQTMQKVEGNVTFHTACSTAFPQPRPGSAASAGPMTVPAGQLRGLLGVTSVQFQRGSHSLAVTDSTLADSAGALNADRAAT